MNGGKLLNQIRKFRNCSMKKHYSNEKEAEQARLSVEGKFKEKMKHYKCPLCKSYHLTREKK